MSKPELVHDPYWNRYIDLVEQADVAAALKAQERELAESFDAIGEERSTFRYAAGKWSIKQLVNHVADTERIFGYRALSIARGDTRSLPGFDEQLFAANADSDRRAFHEIAGEMLSVRRSTIALFDGLSAAAWDRVGTANDNRISVRSLAYVTAGHARHHLNVLRERYLSAQ